MHPNNDDFRSALDAPPAINPLTLIFENRELERDYRVSMRKETMRLVRFGLVVAIFIYVLFGALDVWFIEDSDVFAWAMIIRGAVFLLTAVTLMASYTELFSRRREEIMLALSLILALGLTAGIARVPEEVADRYYVGYLLITMGAHTVFMLPFPFAAPLTVFMLVLYLGCEATFGHLLDAPTLNNVVFIVSALIIMGVGGYSAELQRRLSYFRRRVIEHHRERSEHIALHDPLTGLPNRRLLLERLTRAVARDERFRRHALVLFIDLDGFKQINDLYGHAFGDGLLTCVAERLRKCVRSTDTVARLGGDEFVVVVEDLESADCVTELRAHIEAAFAQPCRVEELDVPVEMSIGTALHPEDGHTAEIVLDAADRRMYEAKRAHGRRSR